MIYYTNTLDIIELENPQKGMVSYNDSSAYLGPKEAITSLPTNSEWPSPKFVGKRNIVDKNGTTKVTNFDYTNYSARLLTIQETLATCDIPISYIGFDNIMGNCEYLLEGTSYSGSDQAYWLETPSSESSAFTINGAGIFDFPSTNLSGVRPVIEVSKHDISLK